MSRFSNSLLILLLATASFAQVIDTHTTVRHHREQVIDQPPEIAQAEDAIQKNDFSTAETLLKKALAEADKADANKTDPNNKEKSSDQTAPSQSWLYQAWFDLGFALNGLHRTDESIAAYRKSVAAKPDVFESNLNLGLMLARTHNPEAEQFLRAATTLKPTAHVAEGQASAWLSLGHFLENRDPKQALDAYAKAAELTPADPEPHLSAGLLHERQKDFSAAEAEYKKVIALDPNSTEAAIGLTNIYMKSNRLADAEPLLRRLAADRADDAGLHLQLARVLAAQNKKDDAIAELQTAVKLSPNDTEAQRDLADLYSSAGKYDLAEAAYRPLVAANPKDAELHRQLGRALLLQKKFPEAQQELLTAVRLNRNSPDAYVDLAFAANENKNYELTVRALNGRALLSTDAQNKDSQNTDSHNKDSQQKVAPDGDLPVICFFLRASAYDHLGDYKQASADYHHFLDVANGKYPDQEWQAKHRLIAIEPKKR
jgi:tetratricopeptide (TPR) repeat protein